MGRDQLQRLRALLESGEAMLFTGAGFSSSAFDRSGKPIPTTEEITEEIWRLCFPEEKRDGSSLTDLFHFGSRHCAADLERLLADRLVVDEKRLPGFYEKWFSVPWKRAWTLNVDDVEVAAAKRFRLTRSIQPMSALREECCDRVLETARLVFVHLNGCVADGVGGVTFSTTQYGERLASHDPWYSLFVEDLVKHPFVIVGTKLEEAPFWRQLHKSFGGNGTPAEVCEAFIVCSHLTRARSALLDDLGITWLRMSAEEFADEVLSPHPDGARSSPAALGQPGKDREYN